jgi:hypothetical protein
MSSIFRNRQATMRRSASRCSAPESMRVVCTCPTGMTPTC